MNCNGPAWSAASFDANSSGPRERSPSREANAALERACRQLQTSDTNLKAQLQQMENELRAATAELERTRRSNATLRETGAMLQQTENNLWRTSG
jgi:septal ring factor EnvC (AmiA/AmiB activator)